NAKLVKWRQFSCCHKPVTPSRRGHPPQRLAINSPRHKPSTGSSRRYDSATLPQHVPIGK
ncbi:hypothetical protein BaRGS_00016003, partial [Batillaria attramentaria]